MTIEQKLRKVAALNIASRAKAMLALILLGKQYAAEIDIFDYEHVDKVSVVFDVLKAVGLTVFTLEKECYRRNNDYAMTLIVGSTDGYAATMLALAKKEKGFGKNDHIQYGKLMRYPKTAIDAFVRRGLFSWSMLPEKLYPADMKNNFLLLFRFSKKHVEQEANWVRNIQICLNDAAPGILAELNNIAVS